MAWTNPETFTAGQTLTAASMNAISGNLNALINVNSALKTDRMTTTSAAFIDVPDLSVSITPNAATSKVLVIVACVVGNTNAGGATLLNLVRDSTNIAQSTGGSTSNQTAAVFTASTAAGVGYAFAYLDSPATTSATTYKLQIATPLGTSVLGGFAVSASRTSASSITVIEVPA